MGIGINDITQMETPACCPAMAGQLTRPRVGNDILKLSTRGQSPPHRDTALDDQHIHSLLRREQALQAFRELMEANGDIAKEEVALRKSQRLRELWIRP
jgi:hypothetical protein